MPTSPRILPTSPRKLSFCNYPLAYMSSSLMHPVIQRYLKGHPTQWLIHVQNTEKNGPHTSMDTHVTPNHKPINKQELTNVKSLGGIYMCKFFPPSQKALSFIPGSIWQQKRSEYYKLFCVLLTHVLRHVHSSSTRTHTIQKQMQAHLLM